MTKELPFSKRTECTVFSLAHTFLVVRVRGEVVTSIFQHCCPTGLRLLCNANEFVSPRLLSYERKTVVADNEYLTGKRFCNFVRSLKNSELKLNWNVLPSWLTILVFYLNWTDLYSWIICIISTIILALYIAFLGKKRKETKGLS